MTQAEIEAELTRIREQVLQLQRQHEGQKKHWRRWATISGCAGLAAVIASVTVYATAHAPPTELSTVLFWAASLLLFLSLAFGSAGRA